MNLQFRHQLAEICLSILRILVKHFLTVRISFVPVAVFKEHEGAFQERVDAATAVDHNRLTYVCGCAVGRNLLDAPDQVLHEPELRNILRLKVRKLLRKIIRIHVAISRYKYLLFAVSDEREITAPFVLHPDRIEVLRLRRQYDHDFCRIQGSKDIRLVCGAEFVLQRDAREEDLEALMAELMVKIVRQNRVRCSPAVLVRLLVADEDIKRFLFLRDGENPFLDRIDRAGLFYI